MTAGETVWVVEECRDPADFYEADVWNVVGVFVSDQAAREAHPANGWTKDDDSWSSDDGTLIVIPMVVEGRPVRCRHCHEVDPTHDPECPDHP